MAKIQMKTPLVEMDGDEMTRILWQMIKDKLILPYVDLKTEYYDLGLLNRNETKDQVTIDAANANKKYGVAVKCATITPNKQRMVEYPQLTEMWKSPNGTIRSILDGTVFRTPICIPSIKPVVKNWKEPITIARHAYGDVYKSVDMYTEEPGTCTMTFKGESGEEKTLTVQKVNGPAVWQGAHNKESSIRSFAKACFQYAIDTKQDLWFSTKDTIAKIYDGQFKKVFEEEFEAAHGTVTQHYYKHLKGEKTSTNSMATIFAWSGAFKKRGELDELPELVAFGEKLEEACFDTLNAGIMTKDLVGLVEPGFEAKAVNSEEFLDAISERLAAKLA